MSNLARELERTADYLQETRLILTGYYMEALKQGIPTIMTADQLRAYEDQENKARKIAREEALKEIGGESCG
jgi:hypothetical protein